MRFKNLYAYQRHLKFMAKIYKSPLFWKTDERKDFPRIHSRTHTLSSVFYCPSAPQDPQTYMDFNPMSTHVNLGKGREIKKISFQMTDV